MKIYNTSRDYELLKQFLDMGVSVAGVTSAGTMCLIGPDDYERCLRLRMEYLLPSAWLPTSVRPAPDVEVLALNAMGKVQFAHVVDRNKKIIMLDGTAVPVKNFDGWNTPDIVLWMPMPEVKVEVSLEDRIVDLFGRNRVLSATSPLFIAYCMDRGKVRPEFEKLVSRGVIRASRNVENAFELNKR